MTNEERIAKLAELDADVKGRVQLYNEAVLEGDLNKAAAINGGIEDKVNEYTGIARDLCFAECLACDDPMLEAVKRLSFQTIAVKDVKQDDGKSTKREVIQKERQIDIAKLHDIATGGIGHNKDWPLMIQKLNLLMTVEVAKELGIDPTNIYNCYKISDIAREYKMGKTPASKTNLLKTLTMIVQAMIGEDYKPTSHDVNFLIRAYTRKDRRALTIACANHKYMRGYIMEICHKIALGKEYSVRHPEKKA